MDLVKLEPAIKNYIWGGRNLKKYGKVSSEDDIAECWELSFHLDGPSIIASGKDSGKLLKDVVSSEELGTLVNKFPFFPVLIKLIDSDENLSIQVHPSDDYALKNENSFGKTEMWYVLDAKKDSGLYIGFKKDTDKSLFLNSLEDGSVLDLLNFYKVKRGDVFFIKPGTIHAIGKGVTLIEIQQNSNLTYRVYDYKRKDKNGNFRELHLDKALKVLDFSKYIPSKNVGNVVGSCKYFTSYLFDTNNHKEIINDDTSFSSITFISGSGSINNLAYKTYDTFFIPANKSCVIDGNGQYILTKVI